MSIHATSSRGTSTLATLALVPTEFRRPPRRHYSVDATKLTLPQAATLAGVLQSRSVWIPAESGRALQRRAQSPQCDGRARMITAAQAAAAQPNQSR